MPRALVVDDDANVLEIVEEIFRDKGWDVTGSGSAARARERLDRTKFDMVVIDCTMPGEPGLSFARHARSLGLRVLLMTGDIDRLSDTEAIEFAVLAKPFRINELMKAVDGVLNAIGPANATRPSL